MSSTSAIIGTGLKKCTPRKRSGRGMTAASDVIEIDDVFDAMSASALASASDLPQDLELELEVLGGGLDDEVAAARGRRRTSCP